MFNKLHVKIDHNDQTITIRRGWFGEPIVFSGGYYTDYTMDEVVREFEAIENE